MKKFILGSIAVLSIAISTSSAQSADLVDVPVGFDWSGSYAGIQIGYGWGDSQNDEIGLPALTLNQTNDYDHEGIIGGVHVGYNTQINSIVVGVEGDFEGTGISGSQDFGGSTDATDKDIDWLSSIRVRVGLPADNWLFYATGGLAIAEISMNASENNNTASISGSELAIGYTVGGGVEFAFSNAVSARVEYRYTDLENTAHDGNIFGGDFRYEHENDFHAVRFGVSYHF